MSTSLLSLMDKNRVKIFKQTSTLRVAQLERVHLLNLTASPRSAMQQDPFFFTRMFLLFRSLCAMAGLPCVP